MRCKKTKKNGILSQNSTFANHSKTSKSLQTNSSFSTTGLMASLKKKAAGTLGESHLKPLSEVFTEEQLRAIPVDNKAGDNYFGHMFQQLKSKGESAFNAISDRLVLKSSSDLAF